MATLVSCQDVIRELFSLHPEDVHVTERLRPLNEESVVRLMDSIRLLADEKRLAEMSPAELQFFEAKSAEWRAAAARLDAESAARLAAWKPPVCAETGRAWLQ